MTKLASLLTTRLRDLLATSAGAPSEDAVRSLVEETGATSADLRHALDELKGGYGGGDVAHQQAWRRVIADFAFSLSNPTGVRGKRAHEVMRENVPPSTGKKPWYAAVKAELGVASFAGARREVTVHGETFSPSQLDAILRSLGSR
jgi:hypothetical protein